VLELDLTVKETSMVADFGFFASFAPLAVKQADRPVTFSSMRKLAKRPEPQ
jgi:hypothetical protein